ncbi:MAG: addiction module protein [Verrucomicrobia bacterium]|nr:addiction module protein [Verrucomicrobiota bacterium]
MFETAQIERRSVAERLQVMWQLWDALCRGAGEIASPESHRDVLADRKARARRGSEIPDLGAVPSPRARFGIMTVVVLEDPAEDMVAGRRFYESRESGVGDYFVDLLRSWFACPLRRDSPNAVETLSFRCLLGT